MSTLLHDRKQVIKFLLRVFVFGGLFCTSVAYAGAVSVAGGGGGMTIGTVADHVKTTFSSLAQVVTAGAYIAGMGFGLAAILKFKAHKDNPTQIPIGTPIALIFIAAALLFLPTIFNVSGGTLFGSSGTVGGITGVTSF